MRQPEALRLADELEMWTLGEPAAAELRRLHEENIELKAQADVAEAGYRAAVREAQWQASTNSELNRHMKQKHELRAQRDALLEALKGVLRVADRKTDEFDAARAAIAKAEGEEA